MSSGTRGIALGVHNHQPVGNFDWVVADAFERAYKPFLDVLEEHPTIKMSFHTSGPLLEWMKAQERGYLRRLRARVEAGQVEIVGGAYWEPILSVLPERDQREQIRRMQREIQTLFGVRPRGFWLAERIWEPHLPRVLAQEGVDYVLLDDSHFLGAGFPPDELERGHFLCEEQGHAVAVFPISKALRYLIPFRPITELGRHLDELAAAEEPRLGVLFDDGEKFGLWSDTHRHCYEKGYLARLFRHLEKRKDLSTLLFSEWLNEQPARGTAYLPTGSYQEMGEWALPAPAQERLRLLGEKLGKDDESRPFLRGGFWRNFFVKYEESHWMHKRMLQLSEALAALREAGDEREELARAEDLMRQAQCNCAYWHGLFGGLYLPHLRQAILERIVAAEALLAPEGYTMRVGDLDLDGRREIAWHGPHVQMVIKPAEGGGVRELDFMDKSFPLSNVLTRRREDYHRKLAELPKAKKSKKGARSIHEVSAAKEEGLERFLAYDPWPRLAGLEERFFDSDAEAAPYEQGLLGERRWNFIAKLPERPEGPLYLRGNGPFRGGELEIVKRLSWEEGGRALHVEYLLDYEGEALSPLLFASGWNLNFLAPEAEDRLFRVDGKPCAEPILRSSGWEEPDCDFELRDLAVGVSVRFHGPEMRVWREPIETVSLSESGFERIYQGSWIALCRQVQLGGEEPVSFDYRVLFESF